MTLDEARDHEVACRDCIETGYGLVCQAALGGKCPDRVSPAVPGLMSAPDLAAKLAANPDYQAALADAESETFDGPGVEGQAMIEAVTERRRAFRAGLRGES